MKVGLLIFGIILILFGLLCALFVPLSLLPLVLDWPEEMRPAPGGQVFAMVFYAIIAGIAIWLGIGSIQCKRWSRALILVLSCFGLVVGFFSLGWMMFAKDAMVAMMTASAKASGDNSIEGLGTIMMVSIFAFMVVFYLIIPGSFAAFYRLRSVRATCEARDPKPAWTDRVPLPLLGLSIAFVLMGVCFLGMLGYGPVAPFFTILLRGAPAGVTIVLMSGLLVYSGILLCQQKEAGWWLGVIQTVLWMVSFVFVSHGMGLAEVYRAMNMPEQQVKLMEESGLLEEMHLMPMMIAWIIVFLGYATFCRRYLKPAESA